MFRHEGRSFSRPAAKVPPPVPSSQPPFEGDYEEIDLAGASPQKASLSIKFGNKMEIRRGDGRHCELCGCSTPTVRCEKCSNQIFCLSCDDMYHRHPKRQTHVRKALDTKLQSVRPPLPPKGEATQPPLPPPRKNRKGLLTPLPTRKDFSSSRLAIFSTPLLGRKEISSNQPTTPSLPRKESFMEKMGSLKRFMVPSKSVLPSPADKQSTNKFEAEPKTVTSPSLLERKFAPVGILKKGPTTPYTARTQSLPRNSSGASLSSNFDSLVPESPGPQSTGEYRNRGLLSPAEPKSKGGSYLSLADPDQDRNFADGDSRFSLRNRSSSITGNSAQDWVANSAFSRSPAPPAGYPVRSPMGNSASVWDLSCNVNAMPQQRPMPLHQAQSMAQLNWPGGMWPGGPWDQNPNFMMPNPGYMDGSLKRTPSNLSMPAPAGEMGPMMGMWPPHMMPPYHMYPPQFHPMGSAVFFAGSQGHLPGSGGPPPVGYDNRPSSPASSHRSRRSVKSHRSQRSQVNRHGSSSSSAAKQKQDRWIDSDEDRSTEESEFEERPSSPRNRSRRKLKESNKKYGRVSPLVKNSSSPKTWECDHCTYINEPNASICAVCCRTTGKSGRKDSITEEEASLPVVKSNLTFKIKEPKEESTTVRLEHKEETKTVRDYTDNAKDETTYQDMRNSTEDLDALLEKISLQTDSSANKEGLEKSKKSTVPTKKTSTATTKPTAKQTTSSAKEPKTAESKSVSKPTVVKQQTTSSANEPEINDKSAGKPTAVKQQTTSSAKEPDINDKSAGKPTVVKQQTTSSAKEPEKSEEKPVDKPIQVKQQTTTTKSSQAASSANQNLIALKNLLAKVASGTLPRASAANSTVQAENKGSDTKTKRTEVSKKSETAKVNTEIIKESEESTNETQNKEKINEKLEKTTEAEKDEQRTVTAVSTAVSTEDDSKAVEVENGPQNGKDYWEEEKEKMQRKLSYSSFQSTLQTKKMVVSKSTSPPPQSASTQTYESVSVAAVPKTPVETAAPVAVVDRRSPPKLKRTQSLSAAPLSFLKSKEGKLDYQKTSYPLYSETSRNFSGSTQSLHLSSSSGRERSPSFLRNSGYGDSLSDIDRSISPDLEQEPIFQDRSYHRPAMEPIYPETSFGRRPDYRTSHRQPYSETRRGLYDRERQRTSRNPDQELYSDLVYRRDKYNPDYEFENYRRSSDRDRNRVRERDWNPTRGFQPDFSDSRSSTLNRRQNSGSSRNTERNPRSYADSGYAGSFDPYGKDRAEGFQTQFADRSAPRSRGPSVPRERYDTSTLASQSSISSGMSRSSYYLSLEELIQKRRNETMNRQFPGREREVPLEQVLQNAQAAGFEPEELQIGLSLCGEREPVSWLEENWTNMIETVVNLATNYGHERVDNDIGTLSKGEAREALLLHQGNIWAAVTECVEQRSRKFMELMVRGKGNFTREDILTTLTVSGGDVDEAFIELSRPQPAETETNEPKTEIQVASDEIVATKEDSNAELEFPPEPATRAAILDVVTDAQIIAETAINTEIGVENVKRDETLEDVNVNKLVEPDEVAEEQIVQVGAEEQPADEHVPVLEHETAADEQIRNVNPDQLSADENVPVSEQGTAADEPIENVDHDQEPADEINTELRQEEIGVSPVENALEAPVNSEESFEDVEVATVPAEIADELVLELEESAKEAEDEGPVDMEQMIQGLNEDLARIVEISEGLDEDVLALVQRKANEILKMNEEHEQIVTRDTNDVSAENLADSAVDDHPGKEILAEETAEDPLNEVEEDPDNYEDPEEIDKVPMAVEEDDFDDIEYIDDGSEEVNEEDNHEEDVEEVEFEEIPRESFEKSSAARFLSSKLTPIINQDKQKQTPIITEFERHARRLLAESRVKSYEKAELAARLMDLKFEEDESIYAANECSSLYMAVSYLQQDCELCASKYPVKEMVSMLHCTHRCCKYCARTYFTTQIRDRSIMDAVCPFCHSPDLNDEEVAQDYFLHLDILLKTFVDEEVHELFQRKLRDKTLAKDPNFRWCNKCSSGFIANPRQKRHICPDCGAVTCAFCRKPWEKQHEGLTCEKFAEWKESNDPETQADGLAKHLAENGIRCPECQFQFSLTRGGCMHFTCSQCKYEFCNGCGKPFRMGARCDIGPYCAKLGLHAHHPRNCLFYLRDKEPKDLQKLLLDHEIPFDTDYPAEATPVKCHVPVQKETPVGLVDDVCGNQIEDGFAGFCRHHYIEYLVDLINEHKIDPLVIYEGQELIAELRRTALDIPERYERETDEQFYARCAEVIRENLPLYI